MKRFILGFCGAGLLFTGMISCEKNECTQRFTSEVQGNFWTTDSLGLEAQQELNIFTAFGVGKEGDSLYANSRQVRVFRLPLSPDFDERSFVVANDTILDTLTFKYSSKLNLINTVCGFVPNYTIEKVETTHNFIESIRLENDDVNTDEKNNIKVYLK